MSSTITFKKLHADDMPLMYKWLTADFVHQWYDKEKDWTRKMVSEKYLPYASGETSVHPFVILCDNLKIGYVQTYLIDDYPDYKKAVDENVDAAGLDLFIGESDYIHKGLGKDIIHKFLKNHLFKIFTVTHCIIGPEPKNKIAIRAYEKSGFKYLKTVQVSKEEDEWEHLMMLCKDEIIS